MGGADVRAAAWFGRLLSGRLKMPFGVSMSFLLFVFLLIFIYITNHLDAERQIRTIYDLTSEIKELRYEHTTTESQLMNMSKQSEVLRRVEAEGLPLKELTEPPRIVQRSE